MLRQANLQLGLGYLQEGNLALAKTKLERANDEDPHNADIHSALGLLDERLGKDKDADKEYRTAMSLAPQDPSMLNNYAVYLCSHGRAAEGVHNFEAGSHQPAVSLALGCLTPMPVCASARRITRTRPQTCSRAPYAPTRPTPRPCSRRRIWT